MKRLLYLVPLAAAPLLLAFDKPIKARPPIDAAVPAKLETATFALG